MCFREEDDIYWWKGLDLFWELIYGVFVGSIVYFNVDIIYFIEVVVIDLNGNVEEYKF